VRKLEVREKWKDRQNEKIHKRRRGKRKEGEKGNGREDGGR
jgi:hypothetical protein